MSQPIDLGRRAILKAGGMGAALPPGVGSLARTALYSEMYTINVPVGTDVVETSGHSRLGTGAARYVATEELVPGADRFLTANRRWFKLSEETIRPEHFGALGNGVTDDAAALQAAIDYCVSLPGVRCARLDLSRAVYSIGKPLVVENAYQFRMVGAGSSSLILALPRLDGPILVVRDSADCWFTDFGLRGNHRLLDCVIIENNGAHSRTSHAMARNSFERLCLNPEIDNRGTGILFRHGFSIIDNQPFVDNNSENRFIDLTMFGCGESFIKIRTRNSLQNVISGCIFSNPPGSHQNVVGVETASLLVDGKEQGGGGFMMSDCIFQIHGGITKSSFDGGNCCLIRLRGSLLHDIIVTNTRGEDNCAILDVDLTGLKELAHRGIFFLNFENKGGVQGTIDEPVDFIRATSDVQPLQISLSNFHANEGRQHCSVRLHGRNVGLTFQGGIWSATNVIGEGTLVILGGSSSPGVVEIAPSIALAATTGWRALYRYRGRVIDGITGAVLPGGVGAR
jgi:hypothetical protein